MPRKRKKTKNTIGAILSQIGLDSRVFFVRNERNF